MCSTSFRRLAKSAPENPGVRSAIWLRSTSSDSFLLRACTRRISRRPFWSGTSTDTCSNAHKWFTISTLAQIYTGMGRSATEANSTPNAALDTGTHMYAIHAHVMPMGAYCSTYSHLYMQYDPKVIRQVNSRPGDQIALGAAGQSQGCRHG